MSEKTICEIKCLKCGKWFPSKINFGSYESYSRSEVYGNLHGCPWCRTMIPCNKENMRFVEDLGEGHKTHIEGRDAI